MTSISTTRAGRLPDGIYPFGVIEWAENEGPAGPYWLFTVVVTGGPYKGTEMTVRLSHSSQSKFMVDNWLDAFKVPEDLEIEGDYFVGKKFRGRVEQGTDKNGKVRADIKDFLPATKDSTPVAAPSKPVKKVGKKTAQVTDEADEDEDTDEDTEEDTGKDEDTDEDTEEDTGEDDTDEDEEGAAWIGKATKTVAKKASAKPAPKLPGKKFKKPF